MDVPTQHKLVDKVGANVHHHVLRKAEHSSRWGTSTLNTAGMRREARDCLQHEREHRLRMKCLPSCCILSFAARPFG